MIFISSAIFLLIYINNAQCLSVAFYNSRTIKDRIIKLSISIENYKKGLILDLQGLGESVSWTIGVQSLKIWLKKS